MSNNTLLSAPRVLWDLYVEYLWNHQSGSWVASIASASRVLAFFLIAPFVLLALLDVTSYVIARTLGVIDDTKASTSEVIESDATLARAPPSILIRDESSESSSVDEGESTPMTIPPPPYFGNSLEEGNLRLSGVDMFSPAPSQPPSPTISRRDLSLHMTHQNPPEGDQREKRKTHTRTGSSHSSSESSFAMLNRDSESEDTGVQMRKRRAGTVADESDS